MKKLVMAVAVALAAAFVQAATVTWSSGALNTAAGKDGGWSSTGVVAADALVTVSVFLISETDYTTVAAMDQKGIYQWASDKTADYTGKNTNPSTGAKIAAANVSVANTLAASTDYYSVVIAEYTDASYGNMFMATAKTLKTTSAGAASVSNIFGGTTGIKNWTAESVPEPTSGLLLLLGMAGLALKRKVA